MPIPSSEKGKIAALDEIGFLYHERLSFSTRVIHLSANMLTKIKTSENFIEILKESGRSWYSTERWLSNYAFFNGYTRKRRISFVVFVSHLNQSGIAISVRTAWYRFVEDEWDSENAVKK